MRLLAAFRRALIFSATLGILALVALQGCSDDDDDNPVDPGTGATEFTGAYAGSVDGGRMSVTIPLGPSVLAPRLGGNAGAHEVTVTGALFPDTGDTVGLTGTYSEESDALLLTGVGGYEFEGAYEPTATIPGIEGTYTGPNGSGSFGLAQGGTSTVQAYCGTYSNLGPTARRLHLVVVGSAVSGGIILEQGMATFEGTVTSGIVPQITINQDLGNGTALIATGSLEADFGRITNGTWEIQDEGVTVDSGIWSADTTCID